MTNTRTIKKINQYFMVVLTTLAMVAAMLLTASEPSYAATNTFTVTNTDDSGTGSLRQAILDANATTDADVIEFDIPGTGVQTIKPSTALPTIIEQVTIDGYTQQGRRRTPRQWETMPRSRSSWTVRTFPVETGSAWWGARPIA